MIVRTDFRDFHWKILFFFLEPVRLRRRGNCGMIVSEDRNPICPIRMRTTIFRQAGLPEFPRPSRSSVFLEFEMAAKKKNHPHRKPLVGLTPRSVIEDMAREANEKLRNVRNRTSVEEGSVLQEARSPATGEAGERGVSPAIGGANSGRGSGGEPATVSDTAGSAGGEAFSAQLSRVLKRLLGEKAPAIEGVFGNVTNAEALAAVIQKAALDGKQWACEFWRDMSEGKPVRGAQIDTSELEVESQLDRVSLAALNRMAEKKG